MIIGDIRSFNQSRVLRCLIVEMISKGSISAVSNPFQQLALVYLHFDSECLHKHINCIVVFGRKRNDEVGMLHRRPNKIIVSWLHELTVLVDNVGNGSTTVHDVTLNTSSQTDVVWGQHEDFEVHKLTKSFFENGVNPF